jgi:hypothetical protein
MGLQKTFLRNVGNNVARHVRPVNVLLFPFPFVDSHLQLQRIGAGEMVSACQEVPNIRPIINQSQLRWFPFMATSAVIGNCVFGCWVQWLSVSEWSGKLHPMLQSPQLPLCVLAFCYFHRQADVHQTSLFIVLSIHVEFHSTYATHPSFNPRCLL